MSVSEAKIAANRANAKLSTGPKTQAGKDRSRANALKHGLCSTVLVPEDLAIVQQRSTEWYYALKPTNPHQSWLVDQVAVLSIRIDRCTRMERRLRDRIMLRAELAWDDDRGVEVENLASRIGKRPSEVSRKLRTTPQGCDWLMGRWSLLARSADQHGSWTPEQTRLAFDLLGTPLEAREGQQPGDIVDLDGKVVEPSGGPLNLARREIASLRGRREVVEELDLVDRSLVGADMFDETNPELKRLRRYESTLHSRLRWSISQIHYRSDRERADPDLKPNWVERPEPKAEEKPAPITEPARSRMRFLPFDLEADEAPEDGKTPDIPKILEMRRGKAARKAEARRADRRKKLDRLRTG